MPLGLWGLKQLRLSRYQKKKNCYTAEVLFGLQNNVPRCPFKCHSLSLKHIFFEYPPLFDTVEKLLLLLPRVPKYLTKNTLENHFLHKTDPEDFERKVDSDFTFSGQCLHGDNLDFFFFFLQPYKHFNVLFKIAHNRDYD